MYRYIIRDKVANLCTGKPHNPFHTHNIISTYSYPYTYIRIHIYIYMVLYLCLLNEHTMGEVLFSSTLPPFYNHILLLLVTRICELPCKTCWPRHFKTAKALWLLQPCSMGILYKAVQPLMVIDELNKTLLSSSCEHKEKYNVDW